MFISGFCGESEQDHEQTLQVTLMIPNRKPSIPHSYFALQLMREVRFDMAFMFAYSLREGTHAHRSSMNDYFSYCYCYYSFIVIILK